MKRIAAGLAIAGSTVLMGGALMGGPTVSAYPVDTTVAPTTTIDAGAGTPTTVAGGLPITGSSSSGSTTAIAGILLLAGGGMFAVSRVRRNQTLTA